MGIEENKLTLSGITHDPGRKNGRSVASKGQPSDFIPTSHQGGLGGGMKIRTCIKAFVGFIAGLGIVSSAGAEPARPDELNGLAGRTFAIEAEIVYSIDPGSPVGLVFENCYTFNEDGSWIDPLWFPGDVIPGVWVQHTELPKIKYTATVTASDPLLLIQNGEVNPSRGKGNQKLTAYTMVFFVEDGDPLLVVEVVSRGRAVETCPFDF